MKRIDTELINKILADAKSGNLNLPSPPEFAQELHAAIEDERRDNAYVARIIQYDPGLATRVIEVANSTLYRGKDKVTHCKEAVTRIGMKNTRQLVLAFTLKNAFSPNSETLRRHMNKVWDMSRQIAVLSFILAGKATRMDPNRALMAGIIHNLGELPVLQYLNDYSEILDSPQRLTHLTNTLKGALGNFILRAWQFDHELASLPKEIDNWMRDPAPEPDYADLVNVARAYHAIGKPSASNTPKLYELPAFKKLPLCDLGPKECIQTLKDAEMEMAVVKALL